MTRAERRFEERLKKKKRLKLQIHEHLSNQPNERFEGQLKNGHGACGCPICKPYKHDLDNEMKHSDQKRVKEVGDV